MPQLILPRSFAERLQPLRSVFTERMFDNFVVLVAGFVHALGARRLTDALRAAGASADKHFGTYYRFFSRARWSLDDLGLALVEHLLTLDGLLELQLLLDDTLCERVGKMVALAGMHPNPLLKKHGRRLAISYGHVFVVLALHIRVPALSETGWALPILFRLYVPPRRGGRQDAPSDVRRRNERRKAGKKTRQRPRQTDRRVVDGVYSACAPRPETEEVDAALRTKKTELGAELLLLLAQRFSHRQWWVACDQAYNCKNVLHTVLMSVSNVQFVTQGRKNAALYELAPSGGRRRRVKGARLLSPEAWAAAHPEAFRDVVVAMYGQRVRLAVASYVGMSHSSLPGRLVRYVISRDPDGVYQDRYYLATDLTLDEGELLSRYARRWALERTFQDCKQQLRIQNTQSQLPTAVRRAVPFGMLLYSFVVLWYVADGHQVCVRREDPWYRPATRASFADMLAALRRQSWKEALERGPAGTVPHAFAAYVDRVVAAA